MAFEVLRAAVNGLSPANGDTKFKLVFADILSEVEGANDEDAPELADILDNFRNKLPARFGLNRVRADAKDLHEDLVLGSIDNTLRSIERRNDAINNLIAALDEESEQAVDDASLLDEIKEGIEKATETVTAIKNMVEQLTESDADAIDNIGTLIDTVDEITSIFDPD